MFTTKNSFKVGPFTIAPVRELGMPYDNFPVVKATLTTAGGETFDVAIKFGNTSRQSQIALKAEIELLIKCGQHRCVVNVIDTREIGKNESLLSPHPHFQMIMSYYAGGDLHHFIEKNPVLPWSTRNQIAVDVSQGLAFIHSKGIILRDVKTRNILIDGDNHAVLTDFGNAIARNVDEVYSEQQDQFAISGPERYRAPELTEYRPTYSAKVDIFAFGIVLWSLATSKLAPRVCCAGKWNYDFVTSGLFSWLFYGFPSDTPAPISQAAHLFWKPNPLDRPTAEQGVQMLAPLIQPTN